MCARWQGQVYHVDSLCFLGFPLPGVSKYGAKLQRNNYRQPSAGWERNIIIKTTQLSVRISFGQRFFQTAAFASENGEASAETGQSDGAWWQERCLLASTARMTVVAHCRYSPVPNCQRGATAQAVPWLVNRFGRISGYSDPWNNS